MLAFADQAFIARAQERGKLLGRTINDVWHHKWEVCFADEIDKAFVDEILSLPHFYRHLDPCEHLLQAVRAMGLAGWEIHIVTARWEIPETHNDTREWLEEHRVPYRYLAHVDSVEKHLYAREKGLLAFVEDRPDTCNRMVGICKPFLVATKYNDPLNGIFCLEPDVVRKERPWFPENLWQSLVESSN